MAEPAVVSVEVAFARPDLQWVEPLDVPAGTSAREALRRSGIPGRFPEVDVERCPLGVYGRVVGEGYVVKAGDRIEVYRPLQVDPRDARRAVAARGGTMGPGGREPG